ncbi:hypothetical protein [Candidatus Nitrotoga sp. 1052]|uniref:hypothetical protein n=1 Tax=Candidatus Nitrotoga sp. 1052 TaxID=2886964 RepID=UPI001EF71C52|nr:hypothetical protein [Candidatus Nitrotoga sp. 1052]CAH1080072.1 hypothetical protein NTG1052_360030 [Candidatus Nitrotoga sp. 1052]
MSDIAAHKLFAFDFSIFWENLHSSLELLREQTFLHIAISQLPGRGISLAHHPGHDAPVPWLSRNGRGADVPESVAGDSQTTRSILRCSLKLFAWDAFTGFFKSHFLNLL